MKELSELVTALYPQYGAPGSRDIDITARRKVIDESAAAIAEAFRALEQRAEAAEAKYSEVSDWYAKMKTRMLAAEAKLAELEKQEPAEYQYYYHNHGTGAGQWLPVTSKQAFESMKAKHAGDNDFSFRELFTRPAPAINLAELVPEEKPDWDNEDAQDIDYMEPSDVYRMGKDDGWNACRAAILRNIKDKIK